MGFHPDGSFAIQNDRRNGVTRLALRGDLDMAAAPTLAKHLLAVEEDGVEAVLLDIRDVTSVDSTGLRMFLKARSRAADKGLRFALIGANQQVRKLMQLTATQALLEEHGVPLLARFTQDGQAPRRHFPADGGTPDGGLAR